MEALQEIKDTLKRPAKPAARKTEDFLHSVGSSIRAETARRRAKLEQEQAEMESQHQEEVDAFQRRVSRSRKI